MKNHLGRKLLAVAAVAWPAAAFAYIDPGTGSILIQGVIAAIAAVGVTLKLYWHRFVGLFRRSKSEEAVGQQRGNEARRGGEELGS